MSSPYPNFTYLMPLVTIRSIKMEFDAAQALLDLQGTVDHPQHYTGLNSGMTGAGRRLAENREDMEKTAKLLLSCLITSNERTTPKTNSIHTEPMYQNKESNKFSYTNSEAKMIPKIEARGEMVKDYRVISRTSPTHKNSICYKNLDNSCSKRSKVFKNRLTVKKESVKQSPNNCSCSTGISRSPKQNLKSTREIGTQTDERNQQFKIESMESIIKNLFERIISLEAQLVAQTQSVSHEQNYTENNNTESEYEDYNDITYEPDELKEESTINYSSNNEQEVSSSSELNVKEIDLKRNALRDCNMKANSNDMVAIGDGYASVPSRLLRHIDWTSYTGATRKLLTAVFSRRVLATHSLTGKPSPAFPNKPPKKKLDSALVNDIVQTVVERCSVPENVVRTSITTKCADESKMFRTRQKNKKRKLEGTNRENIPPETSESE